MLRASHSSRSLWDYAAGHPDHPADSVSEAPVLGTADARRNRSHDRPASSLALTPAALRIRDGALVDPQDDAVFLRRRDCPACIGNDEGEQPPREHGSPRGCGADHRRGVRSARCGEHHGVECRVCRQFVEVANPAQAMLAAKIGGWLGAASVCRGEAHHLVTTRGRRSLLRESCCRLVLVAMCSAPRSDSRENAARLSLRLRPR